VTAALLVLNCGSSSVKFALFDRALERLFDGQVENIGDGLTPRLKTSAGGDDLPNDLSDHVDVLGHLLVDVVPPRAGRIVGVGHRVVHGGTGFDAPVRIEPTTLEAITALAPFAPAHQPHNLAGIAAVGRTMPKVPQVACFDTAFHRTIPEHRQLMPLPRRFADAGLRRFGFHGLSYQSICTRLPDLLGARASGRIVICHLGNGCSLAGVVDGKSAYTSMGFTPLDGLMMGRRPGRLDPGAVLWLVNHHGGDVGVVDELLNREAGLAGVSGLSPDMRTLMVTDDDRAELAVTMFVDCLVQEIGGAAAAIGGLDALIFTGGIGENAAPIRERTTEALAWMGVRIDRDANRLQRSTISTPMSDPSVHVVATDEEHIIALAVMNLS